MSRDVSSPDGKWLALGWLLASPAVYSLAFALGWLLVSLVVYAGYHGASEDAACQDLLATELRRGEEIDERQRRRNAFAEQMERVVEKLEQGQTTLQLAVAAIEEESLRDYPEFLRFLPNVYQGASDKERIARSLVWGSQLRHERFGTPALAQARRRIEREYCELFANANPASALSTVETHEVRRSGMP